MKKTRIILSIAIAFIICLEMSVMSFAAGTTLIFSKNNVELGDDVTVTVRFSGKDIAGVEFNIDYDSTVLTYKSAGGSGSTSYSGGKAISNLDSGSTDSYTVSFVFTANAKGSSTISVSGVKVADGEGNPVSGFDGAAAKLNVVSAETTTEKETEKENEKENEKETTEKTQANKGEITLDGKTYSLVDDSAFVDAPDGFDETYSDYKGEKILTYTSKDKSQQIVCIMNEDGKKSFALFDDEKDTFSAYIQLSEPELPILLIAAKEGIIPEGFTPVNITVNENEIVAYESEEFKSNGIYLIYALNLNNGKAGLYVYDSNDATVQRYYKLSASQPKEDEETTSEPVIEAAEETEVNEISVKKETMIKIICALGVLLLAALIAVVTLAVKLKKKSSIYNDSDMYIIDEDDNDDNDDTYYSE